MEGEHCVFERYQEYVRPNSILSVYRLYKPLLQHISSLLHREEPCEFPSLFRPLFVLHLIKKTKEAVTSTGGALPRQGSSLYFFEVTLLLNIILLFPSKDVQTFADLGWGGVH
jgi:hypothetical protein